MEWLPWENTDFLDTVQLIIAILSTGYIPSGRFAVLSAIANGCLNKLQRTMPSYVPGNPENHGHA
jgi:hypothetical protein